MRQISDKDIEYEKIAKEGVHRRTVQMQSQLSVRKWLSKELGLPTWTVIKLEERIRELIKDGYSEEAYGSVELAAKQLESLMEKAAEKNDIALMLRIRDTMNKMFGLNAPTKMENTVTSDGLLIQYVVPPTEDKK